MKNVAIHWLGQTWSPWISRFIFWSNSAFFEKIFYLVFLYGTGIGVAWSSWQSGKYHCHDKGLIDSQTRVTQFLYILCVLFLNSLPLSKPTLRTKRMVLRIFSITQYFICNKWLCAYWIPQLQATFCSSKKQFIAPHSFIMDIRLQLMPLDSTNIATKQW